MNQLSLCNAEDSCLFLIDIQEKLSAAMPDKVISRLRNNIQILIEAANTLKIPVIATEQYPHGLGPLETALNDKLDDSARKFEKTGFSCLKAEGLNDYLSSLNKKQVILTGIEAHICVLQTASELQQAGYEVYVVNDAVSSRKLASYDTAINRMSESGINLITTESVLFEWLKDASNPAFRDLSKLIL